MLNEFSIAFILGIFVGAILTYFMGDLIKALFRHWQSIIIQPRYLKEPDPDTQPESKND